MGRTGHHYAKRNKHVHKDGPCMFSLKSGTQVLEYVLWGDIMKPEVTSQNGKKTFQRKEKSGNGTSVIRRKGTGSITMPAGNLSTRKAGTGRLRIPGHPQVDRRLRPGWGEMRHHKTKGSRDMD